MRLHSLHLRIGRNSSSFTIERPTFTHFAVDIKARKTLAELRHEKSYVCLCSMEDKEKARCLATLEERNKWRIKEYRHHHFVHLSVWEISLALSKLYYPVSTRGLGGTDEDSSFAIERSTFTHFAVDMKARKTLAELRYEKSYLCLCSVEDKEKAIGI